MTGKLPVMVWIHGGSNRAGSAGDTVTSAITRRGIVLVAIQYRLGILGFLSPHDAAVNGASGNYGLMDQIAALRWVQANIARFGGDPAKVTIAGESAGSQDVGLLLAAPQARPLFARAIMESGTPDFGMPPRPLEAAYALANQATALVGTDGSLDMLRAAPIERLLAIDRKLHDASIPTDDFLWLRPTIDGYVLAKAPKVLLAHASAKPVLIGSNRAEFGPPPGSQTFPDALHPIFGPQSMAAAKLYDFGNPKRAHDVRLGHPELEVSTDWVFRCPAGRMADLLSDAGAAVWRYEFDLPADRISTHAGELPFVFDNVMIKDKLSLQDYWTNFVKFGNPNAPSLPHWPNYTSRTRMHVTFDERGVTPGHNLRGEICSFLNAI